MSHSKTPAAILVVVGDLHTNSFSGLIPPVVYRSNGNKERQNAWQKWLWNKWLTFWGNIDDIKKQTKLPVAVVFNGDSCDKNHHAPHEMIDLNPNVITNTAIEVLEVPLEVADCWYMIRGTEAHTGRGAWMEERIAKELAMTSPHKVGARPEKRLGGENTWVYSWWKLYMEIGGVFFDIKHHPESNSTRSWTRGGGAMRIAKIVMDSYYESGDRPPQVAIRNHFHHWEDSGTNQPTQAFILPAWQGPTDFTHRRAIESEAHPVGGIYFVCRNGKYTPWEKLTYEPQRRKAERVMV